MDVTERIALVGSLVANEMVEIKSETEGIIKSIGFSEGQPIEAGALLVELDETKSTAALEEAEASLALTESIFRRNKELLAENLVSRQEFDQAESRFAAASATVELRRRLLKDSRITAPFSGTVGARSVSPGQVISRNDTLTWLVDLDPVKAVFNVPERFLGEVATGQSITVGVAAYPDKTFNGDVFFVAPFIDSQTRTAEVKATIPNPDKLLKPGMFAGLDLTLGIRRRAVVIPEVSIAQVLDGARARIYTISEEGAADMIEVKLGIRMPGLVEVREGLDAGAQVIVEGLQKIGPGSPVTIAPAESATAYLKLLPQSTPSTESAK